MARKRKQQTLDEIMQRNVPAEMMAPKQFKYQPERIMETDQYPGVPLSGLAPAPQPNGDQRVIDMMSRQVPLTEAEQQMVRSESMKGRIANRQRGAGYSRYNLPEGMTHDQWNSLGMYERDAYRRGTREGAQGRLDKGQGTFDDALSVGLSRKRYRDFGTRDVIDTERSSGGYGRVARDRSQTRQVPLTAEEWMERTFNAPQRQKLAADSSAQNATFNNALNNPNLRPVGPLYDDKGQWNPDLSFEAAPAPEKYMNTPGGVLKTSNESIVPGTAPQPEPQIPDERFRTYAGSPVVQLGGFLYTWKPGVGYTNPKPIEEGADLSGLDPQTQAGLILAGGGGKIDYSQVPTLGGKQLDDQTAQALMEQAGGDKTKARELARQQGYTF